MSATPLRVGVIGCGRIAQEHLAAYRQLPDVDIVAVGDVVERQAAVVAEQFGCKPYADLRQMLQNESIDAVSICTPPVTHAELMLDAIRRGVHVLCEKPLTTQLSDAKRVLNAVQGTDIVLMMASKFRFVGDVLKSKAIIEAGILGKVVFFENAFCSHVDMRNRWNAKKAIAGGGVLFDNATHSVDIVRFLIGPIARVQAQHGLQIQDLEVEDTSQLCFQSVGGVLGTIDVSWSLNKGGDTYISVIGSDGTLTIGWHQSRYRLHDKPDWVVFGDGYSKQQAFLNQARHFLKCIRREEIPLLTPEDGLESVRVIEAAYRSSAINQWSDLEPLDAQVVGA